MKWETSNYAEENNETYDIECEKDSKDNKKVLRSEITLSDKIKDDDWIVLLGLVGTWSSKSLGKKSVANEIKEVMTRKHEKVTWGKNLDNSKLVSALARRAWNCLMSQRRKIMILKSHT